MAIRPVIDAIPGQDEQRSPVGWPSVAAVDLRSKIRDIPDFPKPGIVFKDMMPLLADAEALREAVDRLADWAEPRRVDYVVGAEARGFMLGCALACRLGCGFVAARKPGKLPHLTVNAKYALEYGFDALEMHVDAFQPGARVLIHDDLLATGGTAKAKVDLVQQLGGEVVGAAFVIELTFLNGRDKLYPHEVFSLIQYDSP
jgi:adenine phosphoribosyltransferase